MIGEPFAEEATHERETEAFARTPTTAVGADGADAGVAGADASEEADLPTAFDAVTVKV